MGLGGGCRFCRFIAGCCNCRLLYVSWFLGLHKVTCLLQVVADFADLLPVVAGGDWAKWLIISVFIGMLPVVAIASLLYVSWFLGLHKVTCLLQGFVGLWVWVVVAGFASLLHFACVFGVRCFTVWCICVAA